MRMRRDNLPSARSDHTEGTSPQTSGQFLLVPGTSKTVDDIGVVPEMGGSVDVQTTIVVVSFETVSKMTFEVAADMTSEASC